MEGRNKGFKAIGFDGCPHFCHQPIHGEKIKIYIFMHEIYIILIAFGRSLTIN